MKHTYTLTSTQLFTPQFNGGILENRRIFGGMEYKPLGEDGYEQYLESKKLQALTPAAKQKEESIRKIDEMFKTNQVIEETQEKLDHTHGTVDHSLQMAQAQQLGTALPKDATVESADYTWRYGETGEGTLPIDSSQPDMTTPEMAEHTAKVDKVIAEYNAALARRNQGRANPEEVQQAFDNYINIANHIKANFELSASMYNQWETDNTRGVFTPGPIFESFMSLFEKEGGNIPAAIATRQAFAQQYEQVAVPYAQDASARIARGLGTISQIAQSSAKHSSDPLFKAFDAFNVFQGTVSSPEGALEGMAQGSLVSELGSLASVVQFGLQVGAAINAPWDIILAKFGPQFRELKAGPNLDLMMGFANWIGTGAVGEFDATNPKSYVSMNQQLNAHTQSLSPLLAADANSQGEGATEFSNAAKLTVENASEAVLNGYRNQLIYDMRQVENVIGGPVSRFFINVFGGPQKEQLMQFYGLQKDIFTLIQNGVQVQRLGNGMQIDEVNVLNGKMDQLRELTGNIIKDNVEVNGRIITHFDPQEHDSVMRIKQKYGNNPAYNIDWSVGTVHESINLVQKQDGEYILNPHATSEYQRIHKSDWVPQSGAQAVMESMVRGDRIFETYNSHLDIVYGGIQNAIDARVIGSEISEGQVFSIAGKRITVPLVCNTPECKVRKRNMLLLQNAEAKLNKLMQDFKTISEQCDNETNNARKQALLAQKARLEKQISEIQSRQQEANAALKRGDLGHKSITEYGEYCWMQVDVPGFEESLPSEVRYTAMDLPDIDFPTGVAMPVDMRPIWSITTGNVRDIIESLNDEDDPDIENPIVQTSKEDGCEVVESSHADGCEVVESTKEQGCEVVPSSQAAGCEVVPSSLQSGCEIVPSSQAAGCDVVTSSEADGCDVVVSSQEYGCNIVNTSVADGCEVVTSSQASGCTVVPSSQADGCGVVPSSSAAEEGTTVHP